MNEAGSGRAIYVGVLASADFYGALLDWLLPLAGVTPLLPPNAAPPGVEVAARTGPAGQVLFVLNHTSTPCTVILHQDCIDALTKRPTPRELLLEPRGVRILQALK